MPLFALQYLTCDRALLEQRATCPCCGSCRFQNTYVCITSMPPALALEIKDDHICRQDHEPFSKEESNEQLAAAAVQENMHEDVNPQHPRIKKKRRNLDMYRKYMEERDVHRECCEDSGLNQKRESCVGRR
uniref:Uncharacterized protein n=1 Tax=Salix viminalis TaxID=40686 RepID=A0A6N2M532_SALVM